MLPGIADLLISASKRTQIVVTTHSPVLVDAFTSHPEYVLVCEKHGGSTEFTRLSRNELEKWLKDYASLGDLWTQGQIGGTRW